MVSRSGIVTLAVVILLLPFIASAEKIVFVTEDVDNPPSFYEENGQLVGTVTDCIREVCGRLGIVPEFGRFPWKRTLRNVRIGEADAIFPLFHNEERTEFLYYPNEPLGTVKMVIFARKGSGMKMTGVTDLKGKSVAVIAGYSYGNPEFDKYEGAKKVDCDTYADQLRILDRGRVDLAATDEDQFVFSAKKLGFGDKFERVYLISESPWYAAFSKKSSGTERKDSGREVRQSHSPTEGRRRYSADN